MNEVRDEGGERMRCRWKRNEAYVHGWGTQYRLLDEEGTTLATVNDEGGDWEAHVSGQVALCETRFDAMEWSVRVLGLEKGEIAGWYA